MKSLGLYTTKSGRSYDLQYIDEENIAQAVGPLPPPSDEGARGVVLQIHSESEEKAKQKLTGALDFGDF